MGFALKFWQSGVFFLVSAFFLGELAAGERVPPLPSKMAVLGDSISEALLANEALEDGISNRELMRLLGISSIRDPERRKQKIRETYTDHSMVWASGGNGESFVFSHLRRLRFLLGKPFEAHNFAVSGSLVSELAPQVDQLLTEQEETEELFDYITLLIGGNDFNQETLDEISPIHDLISEMDVQIRRLLDANPSAAILLVGIPDLFKIFDDTRDIHVTRIFFRKYSCDDVRRLVYGDSVLFNEDPETREGLERRMRRFAWMSTLLVERLQRDYPAAFLRTIQNYEAFESNYQRLLAFDCFHPSAAGQAELAEITWMHGFWGETYGQLLQLLSE